MWCEGCRRDASVDAVDALACQRRRSDGIGRSGERRFRIAGAYAPPIASDPAEQGAFLDTARFQPGADPPHGLGRTPCPGDFAFLVGLGAGDATPCLTILQGLAMHSFPPTGR